MDLEKANDKIMLVIITKKKKRKGAERARESVCEGKPFWGSKLERRFEPVFQGSLLKILFFYLISRGSKREKVVLFFDFEFVIRGELTSLNTCRYPLGTMNTDVL